MSDMRRLFKNLSNFKFSLHFVQSEETGSVTASKKIEKIEKKIGFYCTSETFSEIEGNLLQLIEWLTQLGLKIQLFTSATSPIVNVAKQKNIEIIFIESNIRYLDFKNAWLVSKLLRKLKIKILFIGTTRDIDIGSLIKGLFYRRLKLVYLQQMQLEVSKKDFFHTLRYKQYDAWILPYSYLRTQIKKQTHFNINKIHVIPTSLDVSSIQKNQMSKLEARHRLDLPPAPKIIGVYGQIDPNRRQDLLIRITKYLKTHHYDLDVLIMGTPVSDQGKDYYDFLLKMVRENKLESNIHFRSFSSDENLFYKAIDIFAVISEEEISGMGTIKALANGTPILAIDEERNKEILENANLGYLYRQNDFEDFAAKVIRLITKEKIGKYLSEEGMKAALRKFDKSVECYKMQELITQLIK